MPLILLKRKKERERKKKAAQNATPVRVIATGTTTIPYTIQQTHEEKDQRTKTHTLTLQQRYSDDNKACKAVTPLH